MCPMKNYLVLKKKKLSGLATNIGKSTSPMMIESKNTGPIRFFA